MSTAPSKTSIGDIYLRDWVDVYYPRHVTQFTSLQDVFDRLSAFHVVPLPNSKQRSAALRKRKRENNERMEEIKKKCTVMTKEVNDLINKVRSPDIPVEQKLLLEELVLRNDLMATPAQRRRWLKFIRSASDRQRRAEEKEKRSIIREQKAREAAAKRKAKEKELLSKLGISKTQSPRKIVQPIRQSSRKRKPNLR